MRRKRMDATFHAFEYPGKGSFFNTMNQLGRINSVNVAADTREKFGIIRPPMNPSTTTA
jgi:hypothetical protein